MIRWLWIIGLSIAILVFGGFATMCVIGLILRHHLNAVGYFVLATNAYVAWITLQYLTTKVRNSKDEPEATKQL